jgi:hypothetical protein
MVLSKHGNRQLNLRKKVTMLLRGRSSFKGWRPAWSLEVGEALAPPHMAMALNCNKELQWLQFHTDPSKTIPSHQLVSMMMRSFVHI